MNTFLYIGAVGFAVVLVLDSVMLLGFPLVFGFSLESAVFFTGGWWTTWFPIYLVWVVFFFIGIGFRRKTKLEGASPDTE